MQCLHDRYIGAELTDSLIRLVEASFYKGKYQFHYRSYPLKDLPFIPCHFKTKKIILSVSDSHVLTKKTCLGKKLSDKEKREYLAFEMEQLALCPQQAFYFDFKILKDRDNYRQEVFCATVRREVINAYINTFKPTFFKIKKITMDSELNTADLHDIPPEYQKAAAIAISGFKSAIINFLPWHRKNYQYYKKITKIGYAVSLLLLSLLLFFYFEKNTVQNHKKRVFSHVTIKKRSYKHYGSSLNDATFRQFKVLGNIRNEKNNWGVIQTPNGKIWTVKKGDVVGFEKASVIEVLPSKIILNQKNRRHVIG